MLTASIKATFKTRERTQAHTAIQNAVSIAEFHFNAERSFDPEPKEPVSAFISGQLKQVIPVSHSLERTPTDLFYQCEILFCGSMNNLLTQESINRFLLTLKNGHTHAADAELIQHTIQTEQAIKPSPFVRCRHISARTNSQAANTDKWKTKNPQAGKYAGYTVRLFKCTSPAEALLIRDNLANNQLEADILPGKKNSKADWVVFKHH